MMSMCVESRWIPQITLPSCAAQILSLWTQKTVTLCLEWYCWWWLSVASFIWNLCSFMIGCCHARQSELTAVNHYVASMTCSSFLLADSLPVSSCFHCMAQNSSLYSVLSASSAHWQSCMSFDSISSKTSSHIAWDNKRRTDVTGA